MVVFNYSGAEINAKVVYYGPALSGKTTNLENIYERMPADSKGKMVSMKTRTDRTLFFDFLPLELGEINGYRTRILLYTVPGQVYYNATRKLVLKGADAVVFVADSDPSKMQENIDSLRNLEENLNEHSLTLDTMPWVMQFNKRDLPKALPLETLNAKLNLLNVPSFEATATTGEGIYETFQAIAGILYGQLVERLKNTQPAARASGDTQHPEITPAIPKPQTATPTQAAPPPAAPRPPEAPVRAARPAAAQRTPLQSSDSTVTDVLDAALREVDGPAPATQAGPPPEKAVKSSPQPPNRDESLDRDFEFAALETAQDEDRDVGRVVDFEDTQVDEPADPEATPDEDFITDPFSAKSKSQQGSTDVETPIDTPPPASTAGRADSKPAGQADDAVTVTVPVYLSRNQMKKTIPIKIELDIQIGDEEF